MGWQSTLGHVPGSYLKKGQNELYVRRAPKEAGWLAYVDGKLIGAAGDEGTAQAIAEAFLRPVPVAKAPRIAAATKH